MIYRLTIPVIVEGRYDKARLAAMREGALSLACPEAADTVAEELLALAEERTI